MKGHMMLLKQIYDLLETMNFHVGQQVGITKGFGKSMKHCTGKIIEIDKYFEVEVDQQCVGSDFPNSIKFGRNTFKELDASFNPILKNACNMWSLQEYEKIVNAKNADKQK